MRANEYVKLVGWEYAKLNASSCSHQHYFLHNGYAEVCVSELKRLVESHVLVEKHGGLISARKYIKFLQSSVDIGLHHGLDNIDYKTEIPLIEQAIADVESCK